ncbi:MAG TPA: hypothetical protein VFQ85_07605 [Mycobacteriales bacterium]|jgi:hypothetical protein|nr:hypothetical protein [Mycobacteriales bacterium]
MFDDLDDPRPAVPPPGARAAVAARAARIRRHRRTGWAAGSASLALVLVAAAAGLRHDGTDRIAAGDPTPTVVAETPSPTPTETLQHPTPHSPPPPTSSSPLPNPATVSPHPSPSESPSPSPTSSPTPQEPGWDQPDGKPGWSTGFTWCSVPDSVPDEGEAPFEGLTMELTVPESVHAGDGASGTVTIHNGSDHYVSFVLTGDSGRFQTVLGDTEHHRSGVYGNDAIMSRVVELDAGEDTTIDVSVPTTACGDTSDDDTPLPAGTYTAGLRVHWETRTDGDPAPPRRSGYWGAPRTSVTLT